MHLRYAIAVLWEKCLRGKKVLLLQPGFYTRETRMKAFPVLDFCREMMFGFGNVCEFLRIMKGIRLCDSRRKCRVR